MIEQPTSDDAAKARHYRARAEQTRALAAGERLAYRRAQKLALAAQYERIARRIEEALGGAPDAGA